MRLGSRLRYWCGVSLLGYLDIVVDLLDAMVPSRFSMGARA